MMVPSSVISCQFLVILLGAGLGAHHDHLHAQKAEGLDQGEGLERPAHVDGGLLAGPDPGGIPAAGHERRQLFPDQLLGAGHHAGVLEKPGHVVEGLGHVLDPEIGDPQARGAVFSFHHQGQVHGGPGALDHVQGGAVGPADISHPAVAGDVGHHLDAHALRSSPG
jgi:hypothetical protein